MRIEASGDRQDVLPVVVGTVVDWPNADDVFHNVFCMSESTPFDLGLYKHGDKPQSVTFSTPPVSPVTRFVRSYANVSAELALVTASARLRVRRFPISSKP